MPDFTRGAEQLSGYRLVWDNFTDIEKEFYRVLYTETFWRDTLPLASIEENIHPGAELTSYRVRDMTGQGSFRQSHGRDIPVVGQSFSIPTSVRILTGLVAAEIDEDEMRGYQFAFGGSLRTEAPELLGFGSDKHVEATYFFGDENYGFEPWLDYPGVTTETTVPFSGQEPDEILLVINDAMGQVWNDSRQRHLPDEIYLPGKQFVDISTRRITDTEMTILEYIKKKSLYTAKTGNELRIESIPYLEGAGAADKDRMVVQESNARNHKMPFPIPFRLRPPYPMEYGVKIIAEYRFGSYHLRYPASRLNVDGI